jgi:hypothetical protein
MGCHTLFYKDKEEYLNLEKIEEQDDLEEELLDKLYTELNCFKEGFHDLFRTNKRQSNGEYPEDMLTSYKETIRWIENPDNKVTYLYRSIDTSEEIQMYKKECYKKLKQFWSKYPNGLIIFG